MGDRHRRAERAGGGIDLGIELLGERLDDTGAQAGLALGETPSGLPTPSSETDSVQFGPARS